MTPNSRTARPSQGQTPTPRVARGGDEIMLVTRIGTACRSELEKLCETHGIPHAGRSGMALRTELKERLLASLATS